jgi:hypothetical protein
MAHWQGIHAAGHRSSWFRPAPPSPSPHAGRGKPPPPTGPKTTRGRGLPFPTCDPLHQRAPPSARRNPSSSTTMPAPSAVRRPSSFSAGREGAFSCSLSPRFTAQDCWSNSTRHKSKVQPISLRPKDLNITAALPPRARSDWCPSEASLPSSTCPALPSCETPATPGSAPTEASSHACSSARRPEEARRRTSPFTTTTTPFQSRLAIAPRAHNQQRRPFQIASPSHRPLSS